MTTEQIQKIIDEEVWNILIDEELESKDMNKIREMIRKEVASIFFDLYRKRNSWIN